jgi:hypothetical protein
MFPCTLTYTAAMQAQRLLMAQRGLNLMALLLFAGTVAQANAGEVRLNPFEADGKWGYKDTQGKVAIEPRFVLAQEFSPQGIAAVVDETGWAFIDGKGKVVIRPWVVDNGPDYFSEGLARFKANGKFGFFGESGKVIIKPRFDFALPFSEGRAAVCAGCREEPTGEHRVVTGGRWGFIDRKGKLVIPLRFEAANQFESGRARVKFEGKSRLIDGKGRIVEEASIGSARMEADGTIVLHLRAEGPDGKIGDALVRYPPGHPQYAEILRHLGGLQKGESKPVPPWPEKQP